MSSPGRPFGRPGAVPEVDAVLREAVEDFARHSRKNSEAIDVLAQALKAVHQDLQKEKLRRQVLEARLKKTESALGRLAKVVDALRRQGHEVVREQVFPDHHWFTAADVRKVEREAQESVVDCVVTTGKDAVRLERHRSAMSLPWAILPMTVTIEPGAEFETWLRQYL